MTPDHLYPAASRTCLTCGGSGVLTKRPPKPYAGRFDGPCPDCSGGRVAVPVEEWLWTRNNEPCTPPYLAGVWKLVRPLSGELFADGGSTDGWPCAGGPPGRINSTATPASWAEIRPGDRVLTYLFTEAGDVMIVECIHPDGEVQCRRGAGSAVHFMWPADLELDCDFVSERRRGHPAWLWPEGKER